MLREWPTDVVAPDYVVDVVPSDMNIARLTGDSSGNHPTALTEQPKVPNAFWLML